MANATSRRTALYWSRTHSLLALRWMDNPAHANITCSERRCLKRARWQAWPPPNSGIAAELSSSLLSSPFAMPPPPMPRGKDRRRIGSRRDDHRKKKTQMRVCGPHDASLQARWSYCQGATVFVRKCPGWVVRVAAYELDNEWPHRL